jgi:osmoprotectant transport system substrate-binding protein/osmoprotectant transport system permease protein
MRAARRIALITALLVAIASLHRAVDAAQTEVNVGSKRFTESYILGEILTRVVARDRAVRAHHKPGLGNTGIVFAALTSGAIDLYAEYTGTIAHELLKDPSLRDLDALNRALAKYGLVALVPLGFNNTYALAMREEDAEKRGFSRISDLVGHQDLRFGLSQEFVHRKDGWPALAAAYGLAASPRGIDHGLAYEALASGQVDVIDMYSTDAKQVRYRLRVLVDDRKVFPAYEAVVLVRKDLQARAPEAWRALQTLAGALDERKMTAMNAEAELDGHSFQAVAERFLAARDGKEAADSRARSRFLAALLGPDLARLAGQHVLLVVVSLAAAVLVGIPLGVWADRSPAAGRIVLMVVAVIQTIPSLALLAFLIPIMSSIGTAPALVALFLYSLLPIVRNTLSGLQDIPFALREAALSLALGGKTRLFIIELPLAARAILAGVKTSAVLNVGTATIAAFIGAGGFGERIASGLALNDNAMLLAGAVPAALLALLVQALFDAVERYGLSPGLRLASSGRRD